MRSFVFVEFNHFARPIRRHNVIVNNTTIINKTVNITKIKHVNNVVVNHGPQVAEVEKVSGRKMTAPPKHAEAEPSVQPPPKELAPVPGREENTKKEEKQQKREERQEEKAKKRQPEIIRGAPGATPPPPAVTTEPEKKQIEPVPDNTQPPPGSKYLRQNFREKNAPPVAPAQPELQPPKQREGHPPAPKNQPDQPDEKEKKRHKDNTEDSADEQQK